MSFTKLIKSANDNASFLVTCILLILLFLGTAYSILLDDTLRYWDENHYLTLARNLHKGLYSSDGVHSTAFQAPGYPFLIYILQIAGDVIITIRITNFILFILTLWICYYLLKTYSSPLAGLLAVLLGAIYPLFFYTAGTLFSQTLASFLFLVVIAFAVNTKKDKLFPHFLIGLVFGFLILVTPLFLLYVPVFVLYPWILRKNNKFAAATLFLVGCILAVAPWSVRNELTFGRHVLVSSNSGVNLLLGNSENAHPNSGVNTDINEYALKTKEMDEFDRDSYFRDEAIKWALNNPLKTAKLYFFKTVNYFNYRNELAVKRESTTLRDVLSFVSYYPLLLLAFLRLIFAYKFPMNDFEKFIAVLFLVSPFLHAIFFTRMRFRVPFDYLMIMLGASYLANVLEARISSLAADRL